MRIVRWLPVVALSLVLAACGTSEHVVQRPSPKHVVTAYTAALSAKDKAAVRPLTTRRFARLALDDSGDWWGGNVKITELRMGKQFYDVDYRYGADVVASVVVNDRHRGAKRRKRDSETFYLMRKNPTGRWLIADEGKQLAEPPDPRR